jgi:hypothetical protein
MAAAPFFGLLGQVVWKGWSWEQMIIWLSRFRCENWSRG